MTPPAPGRGPLPSRGLGRLLTAGLLLVLLAWTAATRLDLALAKAYQYDPQANPRAVFHFEAAYTLLETGRPFSVSPSRVAAMTRAVERQRAVIPIGTLPPVDIGPSTVPGPPTDIRLGKDISQDDYGMSLLYAGAWLATGVRSIITANYWCVPFEVLAVLACFAIGRRLGNAACGLGAALLFAQFGDHVQSITAFTPQGFPVYVALGTVAALVLARGRHPVFLGLLLGAGLLLANQVRSTVGLLWVPLVLAGWIRFGRRYAWRLALGILVPLLGGFLALAAYTERYSTSTAPLVHARWQTMLNGLGDFPNPYGFEYADPSSYRLIMAANPDAAYLSAEYEATARRIYFKTIREHPRWFGGLLGRRLVHLLTLREAHVTGVATLPGVGGRAPPALLAVAATVLAWVGLGWAGVRRDRAAVAACIVFAYFASTSAATTVANPAYYTGVTAGLFIFAVLGVRELVLVSHRLWVAHRARPVVMGISAKVRSVAAQADGVLRAAVQVAFGVAACRALWEGLRLLTVGAPWSATEGYAAAHATDPAGAFAASIPGLPQGFVEFPLFPLLVRNVVNLAGASPLQASRGLGLVAGLALAAAVAWLARRATGRWAAALLAPCLLLGAPALPVAQGTAPAQMGAAAACLWALVGLGARPAVAGALVAAAAWGLALLLDPGAAAWGLVLLCTAVWRGRLAAGLIAVAVGGGLALGGLWMLAGPPSVAPWRPVLTSLPQPPLLGWVGWLPVLRATLLPAVAGLGAWYATGRDWDTLTRTTVAALVLTGLSQWSSPTLALPASAALLLLWSVVLWVRAQGGPPLAAAGASLLLCVAGALAIIDRPPQPTPGDRAAFQKLTATLRAADGPVLTEGWYGVAANAGHGPVVHAESLATLQGGPRSPLPALLSAVESQAFAYVVYTGRWFGALPALRQAILTQYAPVELFPVGSAAGPVLLTLMGPRETAEPSGAAPTPVGGAAPLRR